jgi:hypothetical protein
MHKKNKLCDMCKKKPELQSPGFCLKYLLKLFVCHQCDVKCEIVIDYFVPEVIEERA